MATPGRSRRAHRPARAAAAAGLLLAAAAAATDRPPAGTDAIRDALEAGRYAEAETLARQALVALASRPPAPEARARALDDFAQAVVLAGHVVEPRALEAAERALAIEERLHGPGSPAVAESLRVLGLVQRERGDVRSALEQLRRAHAVMSGAGPEDAPARATAALELARTLAADGNDAEVAGLLAEARAAHAPSAGEAEADALEIEALLARRRADYVEAAALLERALTLRRARWATHPAVAAGLQALGDVRFLQGHLDAAGALYDEAYGLAVTLLGGEHPLAATCLNRRAIVLVARGDLAEGARLHREALALTLARLGEDHPTVADRLSALAYTALESGDFTTARRLWERARRVWERAFGEESDAVATACNNLALASAHLGDVDEARRLGQRAVEIWSQVLGPEHPFVGTAVDTLGQALASAGAHEAAREAFADALARRERALSPRHRDSVATRVRLAESLLRLGRAAEAERTLAAAEPVWSLWQGPNAARVLGVQAEILLALGRPAQARVAFTRVLATWTAALGPQHAEVGRAAHGLALSLAAEGRRLEARRYALRANEAIQQSLSSNLRHVGERQGLVLAQRAARARDLLLSLSVAPHAARGATADAYDAIIRARARVQDELAARHAVASAASGELGDLRAALEAARRRYAQLAVRGLPDSQLEQYAALLDRSRRAKERAEQDLAEASAEFRDELERDRLGLASLRARLRAGDALVSYVRYDRGGLPEGAPQAATATPDGPAYAAFVLAGRGARPVLVALGDASEIDSLVTQWRRRAADVYGARVSGDAEEVYRGAAQALADRVWAPVARQLGRARRVFIVPDGALNLVNFAALPGDARTYLVESGPALQLLSAERDLAAAAEVPTLGSGLLALGGPRFGSADAADDDGDVRGFRSAACAGYRDLHFEPLPAAGREAHDVADLWLRLRPDRGPVSLLTDLEAGKDALRREARGKRVLHLATHGFFLGACNAGSGGPAPANGTDLLDASPLLLSGLALAGANRRGPTPPDAEDGILTAEEVAGLDLHGVEWVVLSACDTGLGPIRAGEGVLGLRRAFAVAGARTVIMSLWRVDDEQARRWMEALYEARFHAGRDTIDALREADLALLRARRERGLSAHPALWANFVASGDWH